MESDVADADAAAVDDIQRLYFGDKAAVAGIDVAVAVAVGIGNWEQALAKTKQEICGSRRLYL